MLPTVKVTGGWESVVEGEARAELEQAVLPGFLQQRRWFGGKGRRIEKIQFVDWAALPVSENRVFAIFVEVQFADGKSDLYLLPVTASAGPDAARMNESMQPWLIARLVGPDGEAVLHDALAVDDTCMSLVRIIGEDCELVTKFGRIRAFPTSEYGSMVGDDAAALGVKQGPATSSNSLIFYGRRLMLKLFRRLVPGINPEFEIGQYLTEGRLFDRIPRVAGAIEYHRAGSEPITLAMLQSFVANEGDGWHHALEDLGRYYERVSSRKAAAASPIRDDRPLPPAEKEPIGSYREAAGLLGRRTAELHRALASDGRHPDFAPEPITKTDGDVLRQSIRRQAETALAALRENLDRLPKGIASSARELLELGPQKLREWERQEAVCISADKIRCHGDYHLAQVLRVENDYILIDFEGEPTRTVAERRAKQSPLKDVAGMLRSYHYAAYAGLFASTGDRPHDFGSLQPFAELWYQGVSTAFLHAYRMEVRDEAFIPKDRAEFAELLDAFRLDKMFYELNYELNNRPDWVGIPLRSILAQLRTAS